MPEPTTTTVDLNLTVLLRRTTPEARLPNLLNLWVDPFWEGVWCLGTAQTDDTVGFRIASRLAPLPQSSLQMAALPAELHPDANEVVRTISNSVKMQFFCPIGGNNAPEFHCASCTQLLPPRAGPTTMAGVWNTNHRACMLRGESHPHWVVTIVRNGPTTIPREVHVLDSLESPDYNHYDRAMAVGAWMYHTLSKLYPANTTQFRQPTSGLRDSYAHVLLQDMPKVLGHQGSCLPPTLLCYAMANALVLHHITAADFRTLLRKAATNIAASEMMMDIVTDVFTCFNKCVKEGHYRTDMMDGEENEDQPFAFTETAPADLLLKASALDPECRPPPPEEDNEDNERVFGADDCEGTTFDCMVHVPKALEAMALDRRDHNFQFTAAHFAKYGQQTCMRFNPSTLQEMMHCCADTGDMLLAQTLKPVACIGDAVLGRMDTTEAVEALRNATTPPQHGGRPPAGHCFGMLIYTTKAIHTIRMVESTAWTMFSDTMQEQQLPEFEEDPPVVITPTQKPRHLHPSCKADHMYIRILLGGGFMYFTMKNGKPVWGGSPGNFRQGITWVTDTTTPITDKPKDDSVVAISTAEFIKALDHKTPPHILGWPKINDAAKIGEHYAVVTSTYPSMARVLRPPSEQEDVIMAKIQSMYGVMTEDDLPRQTAPPHERPKVVFSVLQGCPVVRPPRTRRVKTHKFMRSVVVQCF